MIRSHAALLMGFCLLAVPTSEGAEPNQVGAFMRLKLDRAQKLLEGIALEDFTLIEKSAQGMSLLCVEELWQVFQTPEYRQHSEQFRRTADDITAAAQAKNIDRAALGYIGLTMQCVQCHKYVRNIRMAGQFDLGPVPRLAHDKPIR